MHIETLRTAYRQHSVSQGIDGSGETVYIVATTPLFEPRRVLTVDRFKTLFEIPVFIQAAYGNFIECEEHIDAILAKFGHERAY